MLAAVELEAEIALAHHPRRQSAHGRANAGIAPDAAAQAVVFGGIGHARKI
jgi:hypothetical protein